MGQFHVRASSSVPAAWLDSGWLHLKSPLSVPAAELDAQALFDLIKLLMQVVLNHRSKPIVGLHEH